MKPRHLNLLVQPTFLICLFLLLLNDIGLKYEYPNWITGKLSDFTGLYVFSIFFIAILPLNKIRILLSISVLFAWWKSTLSSEFIQCWNNHIPLHINRVVDYSDLLALLIMPFAFYNTEYHHTSSKTPNRIVIASIGLVCVFSFCFTSAPRYLMYDYNDKDLVKFSEYFYSKNSEEEILNKLKGRNIAYHIDSIEEFRVSTPGDKFFIRTGTQDDSSYNWIPLGVNNKDTALYVRQERSPYYVIPHYDLDGDNLYDVKFTINPLRKNKKWEIYLRSFKSADYRNNASNKKWKKYKKHFKELFK